METLHRVINWIYKEQQLEEKLLLQLVNCVLEKKIYISLGIFGMTGYIMIFREVVVSFLPVGHFNCEIEQSFSSTYNKIHHQDSIINEYLHHLLRRCYNNRILVNDLLKVAKWSELCDMTFWYNFNHRIKYCWFIWSVKVLNWITGARALFVHLR